MVRPAGAGMPAWLGSAVLHLAFVALLVVAALRWRSDPPPVQLALEGNVVRYEDLPPSVRAGRPLRVQASRVEPQPAPVAEAPPPEPVETDAQQQAEARDRERETRAAEAEKQAQVERAAERRRAETAAERRKAEEQRKTAERKQADALAARKKQTEQEQAAREAKLKAQREAELNRALASEEEGEAVARSGVVDEYRALLVQTVERNWIKPPSARAGLECTLHVTQAPGGTVLEVRIGECNGDQAVRESVANAVYRSSPLPAPRDPRAFERRLVMVFKPKE